jgi:hypothetical protein
MTDVAQHGKADTTNTGLLLAAFGLVVLGVAVLAVGVVASLEPASLVVGLGLVLIGLIFAFLLGFVEARQSGKGVPRSLGCGVLKLFVWVTFLP